jgi:hypothetical protein
MYSSLGYWEDMKCGFCGAAGFNSAARTILPTSNGFVVGLQNGSVQRWTGNPGTTGQWQEVQGTGWDSPVSHMVSRPVMDGYDRFVVSLEDGSVQQWTGTDWEELNPEKEDLLSNDQLKAAVEQALAGTDFTKSTLFQSESARPACWPDCRGSFYPLLLKNDGTSGELEPYQLAKADIPLGDNGQTLTLSYDVAHVVYGYAYVPDGVWSKFDLKNYAGAVLLALATGPSVKLNLAGAKPFEKEAELLSTSYSFGSPYGTFELSASVKAKVEGKLDLPERDKTATQAAIQADPTLTDDQKAALLASYNSYLEKPLSAHAYFVPGLMITFNTDSFDGLAFGYARYFDLNYDDFQKINGVEIKPTLTPSISGKYGLLTPKGAPFGQRTVAAVNLGYQNPVGLDFVLKKGADPSLKINSAGKLTYGAELLPDLTDALSFSDVLDIYNYESENLLAPTKTVA